MSYYYCLDATIFPPYFFFLQYMMGVELHPSPQHLVTSLFPRDSVDFTMECDDVDLPFCV